MQNLFLFPGTPQKFMGTEVFPLDPDTAKRVRFIPLHQLVYWLDKHSSADDAGLSCWELLCLAEHHIRAGHLKAYAPALEFSHKSSSGIEECIWNGEVHEVEVTHIGGFDVKEQWHNPLLDINEFTNWFREVNPDHLSLPDNWPAHEVDQENTPAPQSIQPAPPEPTEEFRFGYTRLRSMYTMLCENLAQSMYEELGRNASGGEAWSRLIASHTPKSEVSTRAILGFEVTTRRRQGQYEVEIPGEQPLSRKEFIERWKGWTGR